MSVKLLKIIFVSSWALGTEVTSWCHLSPFPFLFSFVLCYCQQNKCWTLLKSQSESLWLSQLRNVGYVFGAHSSCYLHCTCQRPLFPVEIGQPSGLCCVWSCTAFICLFVNSFSTDPFFLQVMLDYQKQFSNQCIYMHVSAVQLFLVFSIQSFSCFVAISGSWDNHTRVLVQETCAFKSFFFLVFTIGGLVGWIIPLHFPKYAESLNTSGRTRLCFLRWQLNIMQRILGFMWKKRKRYRKGVYYCVTGCFVERPEPMPALLSASTPFSAI